MYMLILSLSLKTENKVCSPDSAEDLWKFCNKDMLKEVGRPSYSAFFFFASFPFSVAFSYLLSIPPASVPDAEI